MEDKKKLANMSMIAMPKQVHDFIAKFFNTSCLCTLAQALLLAMWQITQLIPALNYIELQDIAIALHLTTNLLLYSTLLFSLVKAHGPRS